MTRSNISYSPDDWPEAWHDLLAGAALGDLTTAEQTELDQLLQQHPELQAELHAYEAAFATLPEALASSPSPSLEQRLLQQIQPGQTGSSASVSTHLKRDPTPDQASSGQTGSNPSPLVGAPRLWKWAFGLAAAGLLLGLGWQNYRLRQSLAVKVQKLAQAEATITQLEDAQQEANAVLASVQNPDAAYTLQGAGQLDEAAIALVTITSDRQARLIFHDLPPLPADQVYRFWAETDAQAGLTYCGEFTVASENLAPIAWTLPVPACQSQTTLAAVTVDQVTDSTASGGEVVLITR
ncbi:MAG: anti-sigma factor [Cyanobacteria bacterium J06628_6]